MVTGLAFLATAVATLFAQATLVRYTQRHKPHELAWTVSLAMFALASAALGLGASTGWDRATFRVFYLLGAILNVPWLALGTVYLLMGATAGRRTKWGLVFFSGLATGVLLAAPMGALPAEGIPEGRLVFTGLPRALAGIGSGVAAVVIVGGALWSVARLVRRPFPGAGRLAVTNSLIALGTVVLSSGGLLQGAVGHDEAFTLSLALGISVIYAGFLVSGPRPRPPAAAAFPGGTGSTDDAGPAGDGGTAPGQEPVASASPPAEPPSAAGPAPVASSRRSTLPAGVRGSSSTISTDTGTL